MRKKALAILMTLSIVVCMMPTMAFAGLTSEEQTTVKTCFLAQGKAYTKSVKYTWSKVSGATKYKVYQAKCGTKKYKCVKTTTGTSYTKKSLKRRATYKCCVVAYDADGKIIAKTPTIHNMTRYGSRSNATAVSAKCTTSVKVGSKVNIKAKIAKRDSKKKILGTNHCATLRYYSADKSIATVDSKGNVKGVKAGTVNIYAIAPNGVHAVCKVTVASDEVAGLTFSSDAEFTLGVGNYYYACYSGSNKLESSTNGTDWTDFKETQQGEENFKPSVTAVKKASDGKYYVYLRGTGCLVGNDFTYDYTTLTITNYTQPVDCSGNVMTLLNYSNPDSATMTNHAFYHLFDGCEALRSTPDMPATSLAAYCYCSMYKGCTSLTKASNLPANTLEYGCYACMFSGCSALTTAPRISATSVVDDCYREMFSGCTSLNVVECSATDADKLITLPSTLPDEYLAIEMFNGTSNASNIGSSGDGTPDAGKSYKVTDYSITCECDECTEDASNPKGINKGGTATLKFTADVDAYGGYYDIQTNQPDVTNANVKSWTVDNETTHTATLVIDEPSGNVKVEVGTYCLAEGTKITMADGSMKNIEDITEGESVLTFNHENGKYEGQKVYLAWHGEGKSTAFTLHFDNGDAISIVGEHDLFEKEELKYVTIHESTAEQLIGKHFYSVSDGKYVKLTDVTYDTEAVDFYSIYTEYNRNCIANGMLSVPDDVDSFLNIFKFNEDLTIDHEQLKADIEKYGLFEYPKDALYSREMYETLKVKYLNIIIGKGLDTLENIVAQRDELLADSSVVGDGSD